MKKLILENAKADIPQYFSDFENFWKSSINNISDDDLTEVYTRTLVFKNWKACFHSIAIEQLDSIVDELFEDINSACYLAFLGQYRTAFMHMRSSIELALQTLYFLHHPIEYELWSRGKFVIKFNILSEYFLSHPYLSKHSNIKSLITEIFKSWKQYSKHIHAESPKFFQCEKDIRKTNAFSRGDFEVWKNQYIKNIYLINKLYLLFFKDEFNRFPKAGRDILSSILKEGDNFLTNNESQK